MLQPTLLAVSLAACHHGDDPQDDPTVAAVPEGGGIGQSGVRRLSREEFDQVLLDLLGEDRGLASTYLPPDVIDPFDNQVENQDPSAILVSGLEAMANDAAAALVADPARRTEVTGCTPTGADDRACMATFVAGFGRLALRRALSQAEVDRYADAGVGFAEAQGDFWQGADVVLRALLQHPEFVYRVERGVPTEDPAVFQLGGYEVATRLSFLLWGTTPGASSAGPTPGDALLDLAEAGALSDPDGVRAAAEGMLGDPRARARVDRFHAMWLGYWSLPHPPELTAMFRTETRMLLDDVVFDRKASWLDLFTAEGTFADDALAEHYGLEPPGSDVPTWVSYAGTDRMGLLSHGSFLSVNAKFGDTSPTLRGKLIRERLLCQDIPPPPPTVNVDEPPQGDGASDCKEDRYAIHRAVGACNSCHELIDPVGFGLEAYDREGKPRDHDLDHPECPISGEGELDGVAFTGPRGLAELLVAGPDLPACGATELVRLAVGHDIGPDDQPLVDRLIAGWAAQDHAFDALILDLVADPSFGFRREPEVTE